MIKDKIEKILGTEKESDSIIEKAQEEAKKIEEEAVKKSEELFQKAISDAKKEAEKIKENNGKRIAAEVDKLEGKLNVKLSKIGDSSRIKEEDAVKYILDEIME